MSTLARLPEDRYIPTKVLAEFHGVPKEYLSKAMQALAAAELVVGTLGPKGGYRIAKSPEQISLLEIVEAVEGKKNTFNCQEIRFNNPCLKKEQKIKTTICNIASAMYKADEAWRMSLRKTKLSEIVQQVRDDVPEEILRMSDEWLLN